MSPQIQSTEVPSEWIRGPSDLEAIADGCWFDEEAGFFICDFIETFCCQSKGRWRGHPITLLPWQRDFIMRLFGWKRPNGLRRYRTAYVEVAKKNGKSTLISAIVLALLLIDCEGGPEIYLNACDRDQAKIIFEESSRMIEASPSLKKRLVISRAKSRIVWTEGDGLIRANSADAPNKDGLNPSATIFDELHRQPDRELWAVFENASEAREQPLTISITTAGEDESGIWFEQRETSEKINDGREHDWSHLGIVYRAVPTDDIDDPETWRKANPSLGYTIQEDDFRASLKKAKRSPAALQTFKRLRLNIIARELSRFISPEVWNHPDVPARADLESLKGKPCWGGLDLSSVNDLTAFSLIFGSDHLGFDVFTWFWLPEDPIVELERIHKQPYRAWAEQHFITLTPGASVDYRFIRQHIKTIADHFDLQLVLTDPSNADAVVKDLSEEDGINIKALPQGTKFLNAPTKELLRLALAHKIRHGNDPILFWNIGNCVVHTNMNGDFRLDKDKGRLKIDGAFSLIDALAAYSSPDGKKPSVYESRGVIQL